MKPKGRPSEKELRRIFKERPALREARDYLWKIEQVSYCTTYEDWQLEETDESAIVTPASFWEYVTAAGEVPGDFEDRLNGCIETLKAILAAMPKEQSQATPDSQSSVDSDEPPPTRA